MEHKRDTDSIGGLVGQLVADGRAYAAAEAEIYKQKALSWVPPIRSAAVMLVAALFLVQAALTTLLVFLGLWLTLWLGPLGGGIAITVIALVIAGILVKVAIRRLSMGARA